MIWSTTVAAVNRPCALHRTHKGCRWRYALLSLCHLLPYPRLAADGRSGCKGLCSSQYAPSVSFGQPGCLQGFLHFFGTAVTAFATIFCFCREFFQCFLVLFLHPGNAVIQFICNGIPCCSVKIPQTKDLTLVGIVICHDKFF